MESSKKLTFILFISCENNEYLFIFIFTFLFGFEQQNHQFSR